MSSNDWVLVPREPTEEMVKAASEYCWQSESDCRDAWAVWLTAAPATPKAPQTDASTCPECGDTSPLPECGTCGDYPTRQTDAAGEVERVALAIHAVRFEDDGPAFDDDREMARAAVRALTTPAPTQVAAGAPCDFHLGDCTRCGKRADRDNQLEPCIRPKGRFAPTPPAPNDDLRAALAAAYSAGATECHAYWKQCRPDVMFGVEPDFTEAASDYAGHEVAALGERGA